MTSPTTGAQAPSTTGMTHQQIRTILIGLMSGMFLAALDQTVVSTAIRTIGDELHGQALQAWVTTAYLITATISTPLYGKLSDIYGRRPLFLTAIGLFVVGSLACTFSTSMYMLAAFRAFQGLGAGGLMSLALAILADIMPPRQRAKYQGYFLAVFGTSSVLGPVIGGLFAGADDIAGIAGWRWVFLVNVPIGIGALTIVMKVLHIPHHPIGHRIDWWGAAALVVGLVPLLIVAEQGRVWGWGSAGVLILIAVGVAALVTFVFIERRMDDEALIPMRLFRSGTFSLGLTANVLVGMAMFGAILTLPLFLQIVRGATPTESGLQMLSMTLGIMSGSIVSGQLTSHTGRYKIFPQLGTAMLVVATTLLALALHINTGDWAMWGMFFLLGAGLGLCMQTLVIAVQNVVPARDMGVATSSSTFFRQTGGTMGAAVFLSILFSVLVGNIATRLREAAADPAFLRAAAERAGSSDPAQIRAVVAGLGQRMTTDTSFLTRVDPVLAHPYQQGFIDSMRPVFVVAGIIAAITFVVLLFLKETPLRTASALQERQQEVDAAAAAAAVEAGGDPAGGAADSGESHAGPADPATGRHRQGG